MERDVRFFADLIEDLAPGLSVDRVRMYANGLCSDGGMSHVLACELADRLAVVGGVTATYPYP